VLTVAGNAALSSLRNEFPVTSNDTQVSFYATFEGTHTLPGGPVPPTNKSIKSDYVYIVTFDPQGKITNMSKVWNNLLAFKQFGWSS